MEKNLTLKQDKVTKNTVRYTDGGQPFALQIYMQKSELPTPFPEALYLTISDKASRAAKSSAA